MGHLRPPNARDLRRLGRADFLRLSLEECDALQPFAAGLVETLDAVEDLPDLEVPVKYPRDPGRRPSFEEDPVNAFVRVCEIRGASTGPLEGRRVGIKDNIAVAGLPLTNGSRTHAHTPTVDAVVVERVLDAGGTIVGKLNLDDFSASGFGDTSVFGPARNPRRPTHSAGGSSSGAGAAVAAGLVDLAIGVDQGGSIRMPAAACGVVGLKATHGLVPSFGVAYMDHSLDCLGPIAPDVRAAAELLSVIAGEDWRDPQWVRGVEVDDYLSGLDEGCEKLRVGIVEEAHDGGLCQPAVLEGVEAAAEAFRASGATVQRVSIPLWKAGFAIWVGVLINGWPPMLRSNGAGSGHFGYVDVERVHAAGLVRRREAHLFPSTIKLALLVGAYLNERYEGVPLARAQNQRIALRRAIDEALDSFDILMTATTPRVAARLPEGRLDEVEAMSRIISETTLAAPLNVTGHPALALPSGEDGEGLPTSVQLIGRRWDEKRVLAAGAALETALALTLHG
jgi:amidase